MKQRRKARGKAATARPERGAPKIEPNVRINGEVLRKLRKDAGLTQPVVEKACTIAENVLTAYELCRIDPPLSAVQRLAEYFKVPIETLLTEESMKSLGAAAQQVADVLGADLTFGKASA